MIYLGFFIGLAIGFIGGFGIGLAWRDYKTFVAKRHVRKLAAAAELLRVGIEKHDIEVAAATEAARVANEAKELAEKINGLDEYGNPKT